MKLAQWCYLPPFGNLLSVSVDGYEIICKGKVSGKYISPPCIISLFDASLLKLNDFHRNRQLQWQKERKPNSLVKSKFYLRKWS